MEIKDVDVDNKEKDTNSGPAVLLFHPYELLSFLCFYSPVVVAIILTFLSFINQNFKGLIYLGFLMGVSLIRLYFYKFSGAKPATKNGNACNNIQFSEYGNLTFSSFVFTYTITYLSIPMFSNNAPNFWVFIGMTAYFLIDLFFKFSHECYENNEADLLLNILAGITTGAFIISLMYAGGSAKHLFFNEIVSNNVMCYKPKNQTFKCSVYKDGTLVGSL